MKKLSNISVSRIILTSIICVIINKPLVYIVCFMYLFLHNYLQAILSVAIIFLLLFTNSFNTDYIPIGIVERKINNYYVIDKLFYKEKIIDENIQIGDVLLTISSEHLEDESNLKKNIKFECKEYNNIYSFKIRRNIYNRIQNTNSDIKDALNKFLYNINNYDDLNFNLGYGLAIYYLIRRISKKSNKIGLVSMFLYSLFFYFDPKFYIFLIDYFIDVFKLNNKFFIKLLVLSLININLLKNYSIIIPLLISLYRETDLNISFNMYLSIIESYAFGYFNLISIFFFKYLIIFQIFLCIFSILILFFPLFSTLYLFLLRVYSLINSINLNIRGQLSFISIILYVLFKNIFNINNYYIKYMLMITLILSPINDPYMSVSFIDVGQGDSILIKTPLVNKNILIDTGSKYNYYKLSKFLYSKGIYKIDYLIITHNDSDHNGNIEMLSKEFKIKNYIDQNTDINISDFSLKNIYLGEFDNDNDSSLVYWTDINGLKFLFTGDISSNAEKILIKNYPNLSVDILKVSHHGSNTATSNEFIQTVLPKIATISTSGMYGHPSKETIQTLNDYKVNIFNTKESRNIEIYLTKLGNLLKTQKGEFVIINK